jgi:hypothetical protein
MARLSLSVTPAALLCALIAAGCGSASAPTSAGTASTLPTASPSLSAATARPVLPTASAPPSASVPPSGLPVLSDGLITPGRYRYVLEGECEDPRNCPPDATPPAPIEIEITVPAGWQAMFGGLVILPVGLGTEAPEGAGLVLGWTNWWVGLNSDPCLPVAHVPTDIPVGPTVDDFVDAVVAHPGLEVSEPTDVELGGYRGRFLSLTGPSDIDDCDNWRPWDPGFFVQGPDNLWDIWVVDVDGFRVLIIGEYFAGTPAAVKTDLREMVESIRFVP